jgi:hypothetical protein
VRERPAKFRDEIQLGMWEQLNALFLGSTPVRGVNTIVMRVLEHSAVRSSPASIYSGQYPTQRWGIAEGGSTCGLDASSNAPVDGPDCSIDSVSTAKTQPDWAP